MLFDRRLHESIMRGTITRAYRAWSRPMARAGTRHRLNARGVVEITSVERVLVASITTTDARRAGYANRQTLLAGLKRYQRAEPELVFRVDFQYVAEADARMKLSRQAVLSPDDFASIAAKLDRMDARSDHGPWTRETLRLIADNPRVLSTTLAAKMGRERFAFKADVRKLKALGLTISHEVGYEVSQRGHALIREEQKRG